MKIKINDEKYRAVKLIINRDIYNNHQPVDLLYNKTMEDLCSILKKGVNL
jgi:hypothetical protein